MTTSPTDLVYGEPLIDLARPPASAVQTSPLVPGSMPLEALAPESLKSAIVAAPPGTVERRYTLALVLQALEPGGSLIAMAPKEKGGGRLGKELKAFGCDVLETGRRHQRLCQTRRPQTLPGVEDAISAGAPRRVETLGLWSQPGLFAWDRADPGSLLLLKALETTLLSGRGADLGCGAGLIAKGLLAKDAVKELNLVDIDRRSIDAGRRNFESDPRVRFFWADVRNGLTFDKLDFVVMNPPFHDGGAEDKTLGQAFIRQARKALRSGGTCWMVANRHLPYEAVLTEAFSNVSLKAESGAFKVYEARA